ncbi:MAG: protein-tyrosine-phosphatase [Bacillota bacterium]|jgi:protein-tyrosine phosphatase|nr:protein-tyrosine-phosphatase [Bacillota bacterium]
MNILFVCTGNTCRSSMAEGIFKYMLNEYNIKSIAVTSAGISAFEGDKANYNAIQVLNSKGIDISSHKAKRINDEILKEADLILAMTLSHKRMLNKFAPENSNKIFTLREFAYKINDEIIGSRNLDIDDPYGMDYNVYDLCRKEIETELIKIIENINKLNI